MSKKRKKYDQGFGEGTVRIVEETGKPISQVTRDLDVNKGALGNWAANAKEAREGPGEPSEGDYEEFKGLRARNTELPDET